MIHGNSVRQQSIQITWHAKHGGTDSSSNADQNTMTRAPKRTHAADTLCQLQRQRHLQQQQQQHQHPPLYDPGPAAESTAKAQWHSGIAVPLGHLSPQLTNDFGMKESSTIGLTPFASMLSSNATTLSEKCTRQQEARAAGYCSGRSANGFRDRWGGGSNPSVFSSRFSVVARWFRS